MVQSPSLTVIIPCHNESRAIPTFIPNLRQELQRLAHIGLISASQIIVVDDASDDDSRFLLSRQPGVQVIGLERNQGYGFALKTGFAAADGELISFMDLDETYDPTDLERLILEMQRSGADIVQGDRLSRRELGMSFIRRVGNRAYTLLTRALFHEPVSDVCSGFRVFRGSLAPWLRSLPQDQLNYSLSMTLASIRKGFQVREIPIRYHPRSGRSKLSVTWDGIRFLMTIMAAAVSSGFERDGVPVSESPAPTAPVASPTEIR